jgi:hypothetical protein
MSVFDAVLLGALGMATMLFVLVVGIVAVWKVWPMLVGLTKASTDLADSIKQSMALLRAVRDELGFIRSMTNPAPPPGYSVSGEHEDSPAVEGYKPPPPPTPFPSPVYDRYPVYKEPEPDAKIEDTDSSGLTQTDEELVEAERVENLRNMGLHIEDDDTQHDAVVVESE